MYRFRVDHILIRVPQVKDMEKIKIKMKGFDEPSCSIGGRFPCLIYVQNVVCVDFRVECLGFDFTGDVLDF